MWVEMWCLEATKRLSVSYKRTCRYILRGSSADLEGSALVEEWISSRDSIAVQLGITWSGRTWSGGKGMVVIRYLPR